MSELCLLRKLGEKKKRLFFSKSFVPLKLGPVSNIQNTVVHPSSVSSSVPSLGHSCGEV